MARGDPGFAETVRHRRERARLSQEELAAVTGLSVRTVRDLEAGRVHRPHPDTVRRLEAALPPVEVGEATAAAHVSPRIPQQLPPTTADFTGRHAVSERLRQSLVSQAGREGSGAVVCIAGPGGIGKSALAVHVAHAVRAAYPDGQLYANLRGAGRSPLEPAEVLGRFLRALGVEGSNVPKDLDERSALFRTMLAGTRTLVLLDDAADEAQVRPLLAGSAGCAGLITGRRRMTGLEGADSELLDVLDDVEGRELLDRVAGAGRAGGQPDAGRVVGLCGNLPLAIRIAAARLAARPEWTVGTLADLLSDEHGRLDELCAGDLGVRTSFELSYQRLDPAGQRGFRRLGLLDAPDFPAWVLATLAGPGAGEGGAIAGADLRVAARLMEQLVDAQLVQPGRIDPAGQARYSLHDLLRVYAGERALAEPEAQRRAALTRTLDTWLALAERADTRLPNGGHPSMPRQAGRTGVDATVADMLVREPAAWFESERSGLVAGVLQAHRAGLHTLAWELAGSLTAFLELRSLYDDWHDTHHAALASTRLGADPAAEARIGCRIGGLLLYRHRLDESLDTLRTALAAAGSAGDEEAAAHVLSIMSHVHRLGGRATEALGCAERAVGLFGGCADPAGLAEARYALGNALVQADRPGESVPHYQHALEAVQAAGDQRGATVILFHLSTAHSAIGEYAQAEARVAKALLGARAIGDRRTEVRALQRLGDVRARSGQLDAARLALEDASRIAGETGDRYVAAAVLESSAEVSCSAGDQRSAVELLAEAFAAFGELEVPAAQRRVLDRMHAVVLAAGSLAVGLDGPAALLRDASTPDELTAAVAQMLGLLGAPDLDRHPAREPRTGLVVVGNPQPGERPATRPVRPDPVVDAGRRRRGP